MLHVEHRDSCDIDFFLPDPQLLGFVYAAAADLEAFFPDAEYRGGGSLYLKIAFKEDGEIDFMAVPPAADYQPIRRTVGGRDLLVDAVPEIMAS